MHIHSLQHVPFEGLGSMEAYFKSRGHQLTASHLHRLDPFLRLDEIDLLIVMGGPMGVGDEQQYPWLKKEKLYIDKAIAMGKKVLGVCLGAQLIAGVLGAKVYRNKAREIGWFPVEPDQAAEGTALAGVLQPGTEVFHWHGDTFDIPTGAVRLASSVACANQGFIADNRVVGLQFHLETTPESAAKLVENCREELDGSQYVQSEAEIMADPARFGRINELMATLLSRLEA